MAKTIEIYREFENVYQDQMNNNEEGALEHLDQDREINDQLTRQDMDKVKNSTNPSAEDLDNLMEDVVTGWFTNQDENLRHEAFKTWYEGTQRSSSGPQDKKELWRMVYQNNWPKTPNPENSPCDTPHWAEVRKLGEKKIIFP